MDDGSTPQSHRGKLTPMAIRERIYRATAEELAWKIREGRTYDPAGDLRFQWLLQWAEVLEGSRRRIDPNVDAGMRYIFLPVDSLLTAKDYAAGERREPLTLVQGP